MSKPAEILLNEVRYAERLCLRTARLYRKAQSFGTWAAIVSGTAALSAVTGSAPKWLSVGGGIAFAMFGAALIAMRPAEKAAANDQDAKRYAQLRTAAHGMDETTLQAALDKARETDSPEVEPLRDVAFNDVLVEVGRTDLVVPLSPKQRLLATLA